MNSWTGIGRLTKDPAILNKAETKIARYTLAVDRWSKDKGTDFINCVAFGRNADFAENYLHQGMKIAVEGRIQTGSYKNREGNTVYTTDIVINSQEFCESRKAQEGTEQGTADTFTTNASSDAHRASQGGLSIDGFIGIEDDLESELPFK